MVDVHERFTRTRSGDLARDGLAVLDGYGLGSAHVAGASLGGTIAPEEVADLIRL
ncbi:MAG: hypothetical protein ABW000_19090 [Actinoplanes sp.]